MDKKRLCIVATHPIQYQAPWFRAMAGDPHIDLQVLFCHQATAKEQGEAGFGVAFDWDIPLFDGYAYRFLHNRAKKPSLHYFSGIDTPEITHIIADERFDAVIVNGWHYKSAWQAFNVCWKTDTPVMVRSDSHLRIKRNPVKRAVKWLAYHRFIPRFNACLAAGEWSKQYFLHYGASPEQIFLVPHVVDEVWFLRESEDLESKRLEIRAEWGIAPEDLVFLFVGKFIKLKRPMDLILAIENCVRRGISVSALMVGDGPLRAFCEEYVRSAALPVTFTGFLNQSQIIQAYVAADALVLCSSIETWGMVVNEAMACGRACIVSDSVGCVPDLILEDRTGFVFPVGRPDSLSQVMLNIAKDPMQIRKMGKAAQKHLMNEYSIETSVRNTLAALGLNEEIHVRSIH